MYKIKAELEQFCEFVAHSSDIFLQKSCCIFAFVFDSVLLKGKHYVAAYFKC